MRTGHSLANLYSISNSYTSTNGHSQANLYASADGDTCSCRDAGADAHTYSSTDTYTSTNGHSQANLYAYPTAYADTYARANAECGVRYQMGH